MIGYTKVKVYASGGKGPLIIRSMLMENSGQLTLCSTPMISKGYSQSIAITSFRLLTGSNTMKHQAYQACQSPP